MKLENLIKKFTKSLIQEQSSMTIGGHYGRGGGRGKEVDDIFAGGFVATDSIKGDLTKQLSDRKRKRKDMEDVVGKEHVGIENPLGGHHNIFTDSLLKTYEYFAKIAEIKKQLSDDLTPGLETLYIYLDTDLKYDEIKNDSKEKEKFINKTNCWKFIND